MSTNFMFQNHCCVSIDFIWLHKIATLFRINTWNFGSWQGRYEGAIMNTGIVFPKGYLNFNCIWLGLVFSMIQLILSNMTWHDYMDWVTGIRFLNLRTSCNIVCPSPTPFLSDLFPIRSTFHESSQLLQFHGALVDAFLCHRCHPTFLM